MSQEQLLQYIHFNRNHNTLLVQHNTKQIKELRTDVDHIKAEQSSLPKLIGQLRKEMLNFDIRPPGELDDIDSGI